MLILTDYENNGIKRWAELYGGDSGWNITEDCVSEMLRTPQDHPTLTELLPDFLEECRYDRGGIEYKLCAFGGDLYLENV